MTQPIIFLDIHHVLTNDTSNFVYNDKDRLDPVSVRLVARLAHDCNALIIITSSLRLQFSDNDMVAWLKENGGKRLRNLIAGRITGPAHGKDNLVMRGQWVADFMNGNFSEQRPYVILDDKPQYFLPGQPVVAIDGAVGFKIQDYNAALAHLCPNDE